MTNTWHTTIYDRQLQASVACRVSRLTAETAEEYIDRRWWTGSEGEDDEDDRDWDWSAFIQRHRYGAKNKKYEFLALRTEDHAIQSAVILETNVQTPNYPPGIRICNLASAPMNRALLAGEQRRYCRCGEKLVVFAGILAYKLATRGAIIAFPFPRSIGFYRGLGFNPTGMHDQTHGLELYELPPKAIEEILTKHGIFQ